MHHKEITLRILKIRIIFNENHYEFCIPISNSFNYENIGYICRGYLVAKEGTYKFFGTFYCWIDFKHNKREEMVSLWN